MVAYAAPNLRIVRFVSRLANRFGTRLGVWLPPLNFITLHYIYFTATCLVTSLIFWGSSNPKQSVSYVDSLFLVVSAMTEAGLNTVNLSSITTWQQVLLWLLIIIGSTIWVSIWTVVARKHVFERRFHAIIHAERARSLRRREALKELPRMEKIISFRKARTVPHPIDSLPTLGSRVSATATSDPPDLQPGPRRTLSLPVEANGPSTLDPSARSDNPVPGPSNGDAGPANSRVTFAETTRPNATASSVYQPGNNVTRRNTAASSLPETEDHEDHPFHWHSILTRRNVGRNGQFHNLSSDEREHLGGYEYRALKMLAVVVPLYDFLWQFLGALAIGAWIANNLPEAATSNKVGAWWAGIFYAVSAFNNNGMALVDANMIPFQQSYFMLVTMGLLILAGNTAFPLFLRLIFWSILKVLKLATHEEAFCATKSTLEFVLKYPRRIYTNLFPSRQTWWLFFMLLLLNGIDWFAFEILNIGNPITEAIPLRARILDGLFQAVAVRSGGFYVIPISGLYPGVQVVYVIMMYISVYPVVITMRNSNVYEERSLGIYADDADADNPAAAPGTDETNIESEHPDGRRHHSIIGTALKRTITFQGVGVHPTPPRGSGEESRISFISHQIRGQLAHDLWWLVLAVFIISTVETRHFLKDPVTFSVFNVIFEVVSAYGTVGISVGLPDQQYSFCGAWQPASKLVLCLVMLRGRHRGLPVALDRAVRLPGQQLLLDEEEDYRIRTSRSLRPSGTEEEALQSGNISPVSQRFMTGFRGEATS